MSSSAGAPVDVETGGHSMYVTFFTINYLFGAGVLAIPHAFASAGVVASIIFVILITAICITTMGWTVETMGRAAEMRTLRRRQQKARKRAYHFESEGQTHEAHVIIDNEEAENGGSYSAIDDGTSSSSSSALVAARQPSSITNGSAGSSRDGELEIGSERQPLLDPSASDSSHLSYYGSDGEQPLRPPRAGALGAELHDLPPDYEPTFTITGPRLEVSELCATFLGIQGRRVYELSLFCYGLASCWAYAVIFSISVSASLPVPFFDFGDTTNDDVCDFSQVETMGLSVLTDSCRYAFYFWVSLYTVLMTALSMADFSGQKGIQIFLTIFSFVCVVIMVVTVGLALLRGPYER